MPAPTWVQNNNLWTVTPTPVGDAGQKLNDNFTYIGNALANPTVPTLDEVVAAGAISNRIIDIGSLQLTDSNVAIVPHDLGGQIGTAFQLSNRNTDGPTNVITIHEDAVDSATATIDASHISNLRLGGGITSGGDLNLVTGVGPNGWRSINFLNSDLSNNSSITANETDPNTLFLVGTVVTDYNVLDDQNGNMTIEGLFNINSTIPSINFNDANGSGLANILFAGGSLNLAVGFGSVLTNYNNLDDGNGNASISGNLSWFNGAFYTAANSGSNCLAINSTGNFPDISGLQFNDSTGNPKIQFTWINDSGYNEFAISDAVTYQLFAVKRDTQAATIGGGLTVGGNLAGDVTVNSGDINIHTDQDQAGSHCLSFFDNSNNLVAQINAGVDPPSLNLSCFGPIVTPNNILDDGTGQSTFNQNMHLNGNVVDGVDTLYFTSNITGQNVPYIPSTVVLKATTNTTSPAHSATTSVAGSTTNVFTNTQFAGASGSTAYTINDLVTLLKSAGILKA